jgi:DNA-binding XRE family transcriptional regulator
MRLNDYLIKHNLTPADLAEQIGDVTSEAVRLWAAGRRMPEVKFIQRIIEITDSRVTVEDLYQARVEVMENE